MSTMESNEQSAQGLSIASKSVDARYEMLNRKVEEYKKQSLLARKKNRKIEKQRKITSKELFKHEVYAKFYNQDDSQASMQLNESAAAFNLLNKKMSQKIFAYKTKHEAMKNLETTIDQSINEVTGRIQQLNKAVYEWQAANVIALKQNQLANNNVVEKFHNWYQSAPVLHSWIQNEGKAHNAIYASAMFHGMQQELEAMNELKQQLQEFWNSHYAELLSEQPKLMPLKQIHDQRQVRSDAFDQYHWKLIKQVRISVRQCDNLQFEIEERERTRMKLLNISMEINHLINEQCKEAISFSEIESKRSIEQILFYLQGQNDEMRQYMIENLNGQCDLLGLDMFASVSDSTNGPGGLSTKGFHKFPDDLSTISTLSGSVLGSQTVAEVNEKTMQEILLMFQNHFYCESSEASTVMTGNGNAGGNKIAPDTVSQKLLGSNSLAEKGGNNGRQQSAFPNTQSQLAQLRQIQHTKDVITRYCERILPHLKSYYQLLQYYPQELKLPPTSASSSKHNRTTTPTICEDWKASDQDGEEGQVKKHPIYQVLQTILTIESMKHACHSISFDTIAVLKKLLKSFEQSEGIAGETEGTTSSRASPQVTERKSVSDPASSSSPVEGGGFFSPATSTSFGYNMTPYPESFASQPGTYYDHVKTKKRPEDAYTTAQDLIHRVDKVFSQQRIELESWILQGATNDFKTGKEKVDSYFMNFHEEYPTVLDLKIRKNDKGESEVVDKTIMEGDNLVQQEQPPALSTTVSTNEKKVNRLLQLALERPATDTKLSLNPGIHELTMNSDTESSVQGLLSFSENLLNKIHKDLDINK